MTYVLAFAADEWEDLGENPVLVHVGAPSELARHYAKRELCHPLYRFCEVAAAYDDSLRDEEVVAGLFTFRCPDGEEHEIFEEEGEEDAERAAEVMREDAPECEVEWEARRTSRLALLVALILRARSRELAPGEALEAAERLVEGAVEIGR